VAHRLISRLVGRTLDGLPIPLHKIPVPQRARALFESESSVASERRRQRALTIASVLRSIVSFTVFAVAFVMILGELGLNIAPVLASAGIAGLALGFGAQNLVKDFLSGIFMILEDQYGVGDFVDAGLASGTVEAVGLRTTRLRDADGGIWHLRNGEVLRIGNLSQGWSRVVVDVPIGYSADISDVVDVLRVAVTSVADDPDHAELFVEPPAVEGIQSYEDKWLTVRVVARTRAREQDAVGRALRLAIKGALDREHIDSPAAAVVAEPPA
jgi:small conductance mechanosensitive channel